ncbi:MAG: VOC family protein [Pseudomonadota bacterium]
MSDKNSNSATSDGLKALPVLPTLNIRETIQFYQGELGFDAMVFGDEHYLIVRRGEIKLHFWLTTRRDFCENSSVYIRGDAIDALHAEFSLREDIKIMPLMDREWGMREFYVNDPHGNLLRFGRELPDQNQHRRHGP